MYDNIIHELKVDGERLGFFKSDDYTIVFFNHDLKDAIQKHYYGPYREIALSLIADEMQSKGWHFKVLCCKTAEYKDDKLKL